MLNQMGLGFVFTARDLASGAIGNLERNFMSLDRRVGLGTDRIDGAFRRLGLALTTFTAGALPVGLGLSLANSAGQFEQAIAAVGAVSGASEAQLKRLHDAAIDAGIATQFSPTEATMGLRELAQAGFSVAESVGLLNPVLGLAAGSLGELTPQQAAGLAAQTMKAFGLATEEAALAVDRLLKGGDTFAFGAGDLALALGTASRGAQAMNQSLSETIIAFGMVKDLIPGVERASTAVAVAMERMADPTTQRALQGIGVAVTDSQGRFRSFLDIVTDMTPELERMTEAQRSAFLLSTFGREALGGVSAIMTRLKSGTTLATGEFVQGRAALERFRDELENAAGTADRFRDRMLGTFEGQKKLLRGSLQTLAIVLGEPFAAVWKPIVSVILAGLNAVLGVLRQTPAPVLRAAAAIAIGAGAFVALIGAVLAAKAGLALLSIGLRAVGLSFGGLVATFGPAILIVAALGAVVAAFAHAFKTNLGGVADFVRRIGSQIALAFRALVQLFEQGGFSGAVRDELNAWGGGLKAFLIGVYQVAYRLQQLWAGISEGFTAAIDVARPVFEDLAGALAELGAEISTIFSGLVGGAASLPSSEFVSFGEAVGAVVGAVVTSVARVIATFAHFFGGVLSGIRSLKASFSPAIDAVVSAFRRLQRAWSALMGTAESATGAAGTMSVTWRDVGEVIGKVLGGIATVAVVLFSAIIEAAAAVVDVVRWIADGFVAAGQEIDRVDAAITGWLLESLPNALASGWDTLTAFFRSAAQFFLGIGRWFTEVFRSIADGIASFLAPVVEFFRGVGRAIKAVFDAISDLVIQLLRQIPDELLPSSLERLARSPLSTEVQRADPFAATLPSRTSAPSGSTMGAMPAVVEAGGRTRVFDQLEQNLLAFANREAAQRGQAPPFTINLQIDGETIARASRGADRDAASRTFSPVPAY